MTKQKHIMILGAGRGQLGLIKAAKNLGLETTVVTLPGGYTPGIGFADRILNLDITNAEEILAAAKFHDIDGIATSCQDTAIRSVGRVADALNLPGISERAALLCADKALMKDAFVLNEVKTARHLVVRDQDELTNAYRELGFPIIIKATDLQGSKGIAIARNIPEAKTAYAYAMSESNREYVIVEEFLEGFEFGAQALVHNGIVQFTLPHGDELFMARTAVPIGHSVPLEQPIGVQSQAREQAVRSIRALNLDNCAVNIDFILRDGTVYVLEVTGRVGANGLPELVSKHYGINYYETIARLAIGIPLSLDAALPEAQRPAVAVRMLSAPNSFGRISAIVVDSARSPETDFWLFREVGDVLNGFSSSADCIGQIAVEAGSLRKAIDLLDIAESSVQFITTNL